MTDGSLDDIVRTSVEVDREVWRALKAEAIRQGNGVSEQLESDLRAAYDDDLEGADE